MDHGSLGGQLLELAGSWRTFLTAADDDSVRKNPAPGIFSPIQYGAHVRDIQRVYGDRILLMLTEENPVFPQFNPDEDAWNGYNQLDRGVLADDIEEQAQRLSRILHQLEPDDWSRTMTRDGGNDGVFRFTVSVA